MNDNHSELTPLEAWHVISSCMNELVNVRSAIFGKGFSQEEVKAEVICFEALRRMDEEMNDRYLFKAKTCNGEWVIGLLANKENKYYISNKVGMPFAFEVRSDTICQCTGLKDNARNLIWENDIVYIPYEDGFSLICWSDTEAMWEMYNKTEGIILTFDNYWSKQIEVIGNRFDDPNYG